MLLGVIVLTIKWHPVAVTIVAGISMLSGFVGVTLNIKTTNFIVWIGARPEGGFLFAFFVSIVYMVSGAIVGKRMESE